jgi:hypothetical protein
VSVALDRLTAGLLALSWRRPSAARRSCAALDHGLHDGRADIAKRYVRGQPLWQGKERGQAEHIDKALAMKNDRRRVIAAHLGRYDALASVN